MCDENVKMRKHYSDLVQLKKSIEKTNPVYLYQKDFSQGTYLIDKPGYYVLKENIVFNPNPDYDYMPRVDQSKYQTLGFSLGFFAAIAIYANGVYLDLNGFSISGSKEFSLQQRFFSIIELANSPFIPNQGPGNFSSDNTFIAGKNVIIRKGTLGLSSHHGIHANLAHNILLEKLTIRDFEFVGAAFNGGGCIFAHKVVIKDNRQDVPVLATYSAARFARMFAKKLLTYSLTNAQKTELTQRLQKLEVEMNKTFQEVKNNQKVSSQLFANKSGLPDGILYGFLAKNKGFAVNEFENSGEKTKNVFLRKVQVNNLKCRVDEIIALSGKDGKGAQNDVAGAVLQIDKIKDAEGKYKGTVLSELQLYLAELALALNIQLGKNNITSDTIEWAKSGASIQTLLDKGYVYKCGGDSMFHNLKYPESYRFDALDNLVLEKCSFHKLKNYGCLGNDVAAGHYQKSHDASKRNGYSGCDVVGLNISYCSDVQLYKFHGDKLFSKDGNATGINIMFESSNVKIDEIILHNLKAGTFKNGKWRGENYFGQTVEYQNELPNKKPIAVGIKYQNGSVTDMKDVSVKDMRSCEDPIKILKV